MARLANFGSRTKSGRELRLGCVVLAPLNIATRFYRGRMTKNPAIDPDFIKRLEQRADVQQLLDEDDAAPVLVRTDAGLLRLREGVPTSRASCPSRRTASGSILCGHVKCRHHLHLTNDDGRPWGNRPRHTVVPFWLTSPTPPTCSLDLAERTRGDQQRGMSTEEMSQALTVHPTLSRRRVAEGLRSLQRRGVNVQAWQLVIDEEEEAATHA